MVSTGSAVLQVYVLPANAANINQWLCSDRERDSGASEVVNASVRPADAVNVRVSTRLYQV